MFRTNKYQTKIFQVGYLGCCTSYVWEGSRSSSGASVPFFLTGAWVINQNSSCLFKMGKVFNVKNQNESPFFLDGELVYKCE